MSPKTHVWTRREIESLIAEGRRIIILDGQVVKADTWLPYHPGGDKSIMHMIGRDAADEIRALHSKEAQTYMQKFVIGKIEGRWENFLPSIQGGIFKTLASKHEEDKSLFEEDSSVSGRSTPPSPLSDTEETRNEVRLRRPGNETPFPQISPFPSSAAEKAKLTSTEALTAQSISTDLSKYPRLDKKSQDEIISKYRQLDKKIGIRWTLPMPL